MEKTAIVILADGFEEVEAVTPIDMLRRAGVNVTVAGLSSEVANGANGMRFCCDAVLKDVADRKFDAVVLPGGMPGASNLHASPVVRKMLESAAKDGRFICAICASPAVVLGQLGLLEGRKAVCYPGMESVSPSVSFGTDRAVRDGNFITSRGPGCSMDFALAIVSALVSPETAALISQQTVWGDR